MDTKFGTLDTINDKKYAICEFYHSNLSPWAIRRGIRNLWRWFPLIWQDCDWDQDYIYRLLKKKLELMSRTHGVSMGWPEEQEKMKVCIALIERIQADDYFDMDYVLDKKNPKSLMEFPRMCAYDHNEYMIKQDVRLLFSILQKNIRCWWD